MGVCADTPTLPYLAALAAAFCGLFLHPEALCSNSVVQPGMDPHAAAAAVTPKQLLWAFPATAAAALPLLGSMLWYHLQLHRRWILLATYTLPTAVVLATLALGRPTHMDAWFCSGILP